MTNTVYENLYDIVEQRLKEYDGKMLCRKDVYLFSLDNEPGICDGEKLSTLAANEDFFQGAFLSLLNRLPDEAVTKDWESNIKSKKSKVFQAKLMNTLLASPEAFIKSSALINDTIMSPRMRPQPVLEQLIRTTDPVQPEAGESQPEPARLGVKDRLYKVYQKFPAPVRKVAHRIVRGK